jgi:hypothetical protein
MISNDFRWFQVISDDFRWFQMISDDFGWFQVISSDFIDFKWFQVISLISNDFTWFQVISGDFKWFRAFEISLFPLVDPLHWTSLPSIVFIRTKETKYICCKTYSIESFEFRSFYIYWKNFPLDFISIFLIHFKQKAYFNFKKMIKQIWFIIKEVLIVFVCFFIPVILFFLVRMGATRKVIHCSFHHHEMLI